MTLDQLSDNIISKRSFLCIGLDSDISKIPAVLLQGKDPQFEFNRRIVDATAEFAVAYKPNLAFYESRGAEGLVSLARTAEYIKKNYPDIFLIADAKRGDIGNTSRMYARAFFEEMPFDAVTVAPYMGEDSVTPFLEYKGKWVILLALTSNKGADDFQYFSDGKSRLFEKVLERSESWGDERNMMYVVGATRAEMLKEIRKRIPGHFLLIPGIGAQGGSLEEVVEYGINPKCGLLVNSSRGIIFAGGGEDFDKAAAREAADLRQQMAGHLERSGIL